MSSFYFLDFLEDWLWTLMYMCNINPLCLVFLIVCYKPQVGMRSRVTLGFRTLLVSDRQRYGFFCDNLFALLGSLFCSTCLSQEFQSVMLLELILNSASMQPRFSCPFGLCWRGIVLRCLLFAGRDFANCTPLRYKFMTGYSV